MRFRAIVKLVLESFYEIEYKCCNHTVTQVMKPPEDGVGDACPECHSRVVIEYDSVHVL
jgi:hypothetical protein